MKKLFCALLAAAMLLTTAACAGTAVSSSAASSSDGGAASEATSSEAEDPILTGEKPELKILSMYQAYNYEEQPSYKQLEEITGYVTHWYALPQENSDQKLLLEISTGADYDLLLRMGSSGYSQLSAQGALIELNDILDKYGSNITKEISDFAWQSTTDSKGTINAIPHEDMVASPSEPYGMFTGGIGVRSDLLEELDTKLPTTLDEFTAFLENAKEKLGFAPLTANKSSIFNQAVMMAFGMGGPEWYDVDGVYTHRIKHPQITKYLAYMQKLYKEGLLDNDMPINTSDNAKEKFASKNALALMPLMFWDIPSMVSALATSNPDCKIEFITGLSADSSEKGTYYIQRGAKTFTCVSQNSKNAEHAINWLNIISEEENYRLVYIGEEGVSYELKNDSYYPIFTDDESDADFSHYTNSDKFSGINDPVESFKMWQARARKTPEMAEAYEAMNAHVDEYNVEYNIESYGKTAPVVQEYNTALGTEFADAFLKAVVDGTDPEQAVAAMRANWDKNGGLEMEAAMQEYYEANKQYAE